ncbi:hypothetical protein MMC11_002679 [Xylographa trunciseda]|nr:hypothetical protein [Xylographa trunciseda]
MADTLGGEPPTQQVVALDQNHDVHAGDPAEGDTGAANIPLPPSLDSSGGSEASPAEVEDHPEDPWDWMTYVDNEECFMNYQSNLAAKTSDFGSGGHTASLTNWHELLQLTAPDPLCGLIYARGDFPGTAESILARAQNRDDAGGKGTFGIQLLPDADLGYKLGDIIALGLINYRWPHIQYDIRIKDWDSDYTNYFEICSFVHQKAVYQIAHILLPRENSAEPQTTPAETKARPRSKTFRFRAGGRIAFGCMCTSVGGTSHNFSYTVQQMEDGKSVSCQATNNACKAQSLCHCQLGMQVYVNGEQRQIRMIPTQSLSTSAHSSNNHVDTDPSGTKPDDRPSSHTHVEISELVDVELEAGKGGLVMVVFAFTNGGVPELPRNALSSDSVRAILGVTDGMNNCVSRIWTNYRIKDRDQIDDDDIMSIARCVEYICSVTAIPIIPEAQNASITHSANASVTVEELPLDDATANSATRPQRMSIHGEAESSVNALSANLGSEVPENSESIHLLVNGPFQQGNGSDRIPSPSTSTSRQQENGVPLPGSVPTPISIKSFSSVEDLKNRSRAKQQIGIEEVEDKDEAHEMLAVALIRNIMYSQYVDLEDAFWQLRFLVKADQFLQQHFEDFDSPVKIQEVRYHDSEFNEATVAAYKKYKTRLQRVIKGLLLWTINLSLGADPGRSWQAETSLDPRCHLRAVSHHQYQPFLLFDPEIETYPGSLSFMPFWSSKWQASCFASIIMNYVLTRYAWMARELSPKAELWSNLPRLSTIKASRDSKLKTALLQWLHSACLLNIYEMINKVPADDTKEVYYTHIKNLERLCSKLRKPLPKGDFDLYAGEEEETDRLLLVCRELSPGITSTSGDEFSYVSNKIQHRMTTRTINPGDSIPERVAPTEAPWELSCLNYHTALIIAADRADDYDTRTAKRACYKFQSSDSMFLPTWDRSWRWLESWWDANVSCIVCATLLDLCSGPADKEETTNAHNQSKADPRSFIPSTDSRQPEWNWIPTTIVFGDEWIQSLEDTPDRFRSAQTKTIVLRRSLRPYLQSFKDSSGNSYENPPSYFRDNITELIPATDLLYLSLVDFRISLESETVYSSYGRDDLEQYQDRTLKAVNAPEDVKGLLWQWLIDGHHWQSLPNPGIFSKELRDKVEETNLRNNLFEEHQTKLLRRLSDSLVDQSIKYRIMLVQRCSPSVVQAFVYMWHPRAIDTFDSYFSSFSNYANSLDHDSWTTTITLVHWAFEPPTYKLDTKSTAPRSRYSEDPLRGEYPPQNVRMLLRVPRLKDEKDYRKIPGYIEERSSLIVVTGDAKGYLWTCSIWSSLICAQDVPSQSIMNISKLFRHQQTTGRNLIFLALLGLLCEKLNAELEHGLESVKNYVELGQNVFLEGYDWEADDAVEKLRSMLWGLEALKMFDARLAPSLDKIEDARKDLVLRMESEPGRRHSELDQAYRLELENFEKRRGLLLGTHQKISLKIAQVTSLRDGLSAVTNVQDSHITIKQGNNIRMLTYITIAYLPLGFITALFSMGHGIVPDNAGSILFVVLVVVFVIATYCLAFSLDSIFKFTNHFMKHWRSKHPVKSHIRTRFPLWIKGTRSLKTEPPVEGDEPETASELPPAKATRDHGMSIFRRRRRVVEGDPGSAEKGMVVESTEDSSSQHPH